MKQTIQDFPDSTKMRLEILIPMLRTIIEHSDKNQMYVQQTSFFFPTNFSELSSDPFFFLVIFVASLSRGLENIARMFAPSLVRNFPYVQLLDPSVALSEISIATEMIKWYDYLFLGASPSLAKEDKAWQRDRKRKTMALFATAEVPDKFLLLDNRHVASVSTTAETPDPDSEITEHADPSSSSSSSPPPPPPSPRGAPATTAPSPSGPLLT